PGPRPGGAAAVAGVAAQERAGLDLVLLRLQPAEEAHPPVELLVALEHEPPVLLGQAGPRDVHGDAPPAGEALQLGEQSPVVGLVPGLDDALAERPLLVGDDEVLVDLDEVPEPVAGAAGAVGVVEGEQPGLGLLEGPGAPG